MRVSKAREEMISPELQRHQIARFAASKGIEVVRYVEDLDESGRRFTKRQVAELVEGVRAGEYQTVILWKWSRWGRNLLDSLIYLARIEEAGGRVHAATEDFDPSTSMGRFTRDQMLLIAELQSNQIGDTWREVHQRRLRNGLPHTGRQRLGYTLVKDPNGDRYELNPSAAALVKDAYLRIIDGEAFETLAEEWNRLGVKTTLGNTWAGSNFACFLDTGFAAGLLRTRSVPRPQCNAIETFDLWLDGAHQPIIDQATWQAYRQVREARTRHTTGGYEYALSGLVYCGECGRKLTTNRTPTGRAHWRCSAGYSSRIGRHPAVGLSDDRLTTVVWRWLEGTNTGLEQQPSGLKRIWAASTPSEQNAILKRTIDAVIVRSGPYEELHEKAMVQPRADPQWEPL